MELFNIFYQISYKVVVVSRLGGSGTRMVAEMRLAVHVESVMKHLVVNRVGEEQKMRWTSSAAYHAHQSRPVADRANTGYLICSSRI